jgi:excisionase family DNA binding protein
MKLPIDADKSSMSQFGYPMLVTVEEAAVLLCIGRTTAYELVMSGNLKSVKVGRRRLVVREGIRDYVGELLRTQNTSAL